MSVTTMRNRGQRLLAVMIATSAIALVGIVQAGPLTIPVNCGDPAVHVGDIVVRASGGGIVGGFKSLVGTPPSQTAAAEACDEDHFNWYQIVTADNNPPNDTDGDPLDPPYVDVPSGGYGPPTPQWGDDLPWYWDEGDDPSPTTAGFNDGYNVDDHQQDLDPADGTNETLNYTDYPGGDAGTNLSFRTWLVSLNADGSFHSWHGSFSWNWSKIIDIDNVVVVVATAPVLLDASPTDAEYADIIAGFATAIPEPSTLSLLAFVGLVSLIRRRP